MSTFHRQLSLFKVSLIICWTLDELFHQHRHIDCIHPMFYCWRWNYSGFLKKTRYSMYVKGTFRDAKNRLIFQLDVRRVAALLGINANALDIFLCIFAVLRVPSIVYYVLAFPLSVWHRKQQHWMNKCLGAAGDTDSFCHFLLFYIVWNRMDDFYGNCKIRLKSWIFKHCEQSLQTILYNLANTGVVEAESMLLLRCLPHPLHS